MGEFLLVSWQGLGIIPIQDILILLASNIDDKIEPFMARQRVIYLFIYLYLLIQQVTP